MPDDRKKTALLLSLIGLTAIVAYLPALQAGFIWDDDDYIENNVALQTWSGVLRIWSDPTSIPQWYPLVHTSFWIEYRLWGPDPLGYHINNLILHLASCGMPADMASPPWHAGGAHRHARAAIHRVLSSV